MLKLAHDGHLGIKKTKKRARQSVWRPQMNCQLELTVSNCMTCARYASEQRKEPLCSTSIPERPWGKLGADLFKMEKMCFLVVVHYYSRNPEFKKHTGTKSTDIVLALKGVTSNCILSMHSADLAVNSNQSISRMTG